MDLSPDSVKALVQATVNTQEVELGCDDCLAQVGAYAERQLAGQTLPEALRRVEEHLRGCPECREEYEALLDALR